MRVLAFLFAVLFAMPAQANACGPRFDQMLYVSVLVEASGATGSGTVIHSARDEGGWATLILTNFHVVESAVQISEEWDPKQGRKVEREHRTAVKALWFDYNGCSRSVGSRGKEAWIVAYDRRADLALLKLVDTENPVSPVAALLPENAPLQVFDPVWVVGAGLGKPPFPTSGVIANLDQQFDGHRYILATAPIIFGNSGGGLFRESAERKRFELIGIPSRVSAAGFGAPVSHMGWSITIDTIRSFLRANDYGFVAGGKDAAR